MPTVRQELRAQVIEISGGRCEWPACLEAGRELAHLHSVGAGGRKSADVLGNVAWFCRDHARISDGEYGAGGRSQYVEAHAALLTLADLNLIDGLRDGLTVRGLAWRRAEALTEHLRVVRGGKGIMA